MGRILGSLVVLIGAATAVPPALAVEAGMWRSYGPSTGRSLQLVAAHPSGDGPVYAAQIPGAGDPAPLYRSTDAGIHWEDAGAGLPDDFSPQSLVFDPADPSVAYAAGGGIYRTVDGGDSWVDSSDGLGSGYINTVAIDPVDGSRLFAASGAGLFASMDAGATWIPLTQGLPESFGARALAISSSSPSTMYAAIYQASSSPAWRVYRTTNAGASWSPTSAAQEAFMYSMAVDPTDPDTVYLGSDGTIALTRNGGATWSDVTNGIPPGAGPQPVRGFAFLPGKVLAASNAGLASRTGSAPWELVTGLPAHTAYSVTVAGDPARTYVATCCSAGGVYRSADGGTSWKGSTSGFPPDVWVRGLAAAPTAPGRVYAARYLNGSVAMFRGMDGGRRWAAADGGLSGAALSSVAVHPTDPDVLLAGAYSGGGVYRSTDGGATWTSSVSGSSIEKVAFAPSNPNIAYAVGALTGLPGGPAFLWSSDGGVTWGSGSIGGTPLTAVLDVAVDPTDPQVVYAAGSYGGLYKSIDGGQRWLNITAGLPGLPVSIGVDPANPSIVYAGIVAAGSQAAGGVYKSTLGGIGWLPAGALRASVTSVAIDPSRPQTVYAALSGDDRLVVRSDDAGATWAPVSEGLDPDYPPVMLSIDPDGSHVYAGTYGRGVAVLITG